MKISEKQLRQMIYECACEAMKDMEMAPMSGGVKVIKLQPLPEPEEIHSTLFPTLEQGEEHHDHLESHSDDQGEKGMIVGNLHRLADRSAELAQMAEQVPDNEEWVQEKIAVASAMIDSIYNYMKYNKGE